jgi:hypothetical protein
MNEEHDGAGGVTDERSWVRRGAALAGGAFGLLTLFAGARVLLGADPGYTAFPPLLVFNTAMGAAYLAAAALLWRSPLAGRRAAGVVALVNLVVLLAIAGLHLTGGPVAVESVGAMALRTGFWSVVYLVVRRPQPSRGPVLPVV